MCDFIKMRTFILLFLVWLLASVQLIWWNLNRYEPPSFFFNAYYNYCRIVDEFGRLDVSSVSNHDEEIRLDEHNSLRIHLCRDLDKPCNGKAGYSACLNKNGTEVGIGKGPSHYVIQVNNNATFWFTGDTCNATHNYTLNLDTKCNRVIEKKILFGVANWTDNCHLDLTMESSAACPNFDEFRRIKVNKKHGFRFTHNLGKNVCNDSAYICDDKMSYGRNMNVTRWNNRTSYPAEYHFTNGSQCPDGSNAQLTLYARCNKFSAEEELTVLSDQYCHPKLEWSSIDLCTQSDRSSLFDSTIVRHKDISAYIFDYIPLIFTMLLFLICSIISTIYRDVSIVTLSKKFWRKLFNNNPEKSSQTIPSSSQKSYVFVVPIAPQASVPVALKCNEK